MERPPLWLALHFPRLGLELAQAVHEPCSNGTEASGSGLTGTAETKTTRPCTVEQPTPSGPAQPLSLPCVLIEPRQQRRVIVAIDAAAAAAGLRVGQTQAQAQALVGQLQCLQRDPPAERRALEHIASCAYRYSSEVRLDPPAGLLLEISRSLRLYESESPRRSQPAGEMSCQEISPVLHDPSAGSSAVPARVEPRPSPQSRSRRRPRLHESEEQELRQQAGSCKCQGKIQSESPALLNPEPSFAAALTRLLARLHHDLLQLGFQPDAGLGRTAAAARLRAQLVSAGCMPSAFAHLDKHSKTHYRAPPMPSLQPTAVDALPLPIKLRRALSGSGIANLAALRKLPRASLQRRFGSELPDLLDRLEGRKPEPGQVWQPPDHYQAEIELPAPTALGEALRFPLRRLVNDLCLALTARDAAAEHLQLSFELELDRSETAPANRRRPTTKAPRRRQDSALLGPGPYALDPALLTPQPSALSAASIDLRLLQPSRDPRQLLELIQQRLEHAVLPGRILGLRLNVPKLPPHHALQHDLFDPQAQSQHDWPRLIERLRARLGDHRLLQPQALPDHRPEHAAAALPLAASTAARPLAQQAPDRSPPAVSVCSLSNNLASNPLWLLPTPIPLDNPEPGLLLLAATERIEGGWWASKDIRRDYYCAAGPQGSYCWIYQDLRAPQCTYLHGWFG